MVKHQLWMESRWVEAAGKAMIPSYPTSNTPGSTMENILVFDVFLIRFQNV